MTRPSPTRLRRSTLAVGLISGLVVALSSALVLAEDPTPQASASAVATKSADLHEVSQSNKNFAPGEITIESGDTVVFLNDDEISHNVFSRSAESKFNLKIQRPGEHKSYQFETPGKSVVRCAIHPQMKLVVNVVEPKAAATPPTPAEPGKTPAVATPAGQSAAPAKVEP